MRMGMADNELIVTRFCAMTKAEWPHRQCIDLAFQGSRVHASLAAVSLMILHVLHRAIRGAQRVPLCVWWGVMASQLDLQSLTPVSASYGRL